MLLHLKAGDGDLLLITEPALLTKCAWQSHSINRAALLPSVRTRTVCARLNLETDSGLVWDLKPRPKSRPTLHIFDPKQYIKSGDIDQSHVYAAVKSSADTVFHQRLSFSSAWFTPSTTTRSPHWTWKTPSNTFPSYLIIIQSTGQRNERQGGRTFFLSATLKLYHLSKNCTCFYVSRANSLHYVSTFAYVTTRACLLKWVCVLCKQTHTDQGARHLWRLDHIWL